ncbi:cellulase family glycosylhydrolase [Caulobacter sp.]|uniref:cellulase family glycosylhydrolase n=1 Tax=Caulobacter sp. TaxID=78 RepID=UPI001B2ACA61|nr:cellulase family glycosylhydrolase [Caulobacter sp.]MBO9546923.1 cellulase family glycosylhydrolase [Caulobacter sp.]
MKSWLAMGAAALALLATTTASAEGWLKAKDARIVDETGQQVILRGMGLGGWMLQEGYMLRLSKLGQQHVIQGKIADLVGPARQQAIHKAWLDNHTTKADIDAMAAWGFNSVRLPMHYDLLTLPVDQEPKAGVDTWHEDGFKRIDDLLAWSKANGIYLILDLHAAPSGQGNDLPIADRDPAKPSLWDSPEARRKTIELWKKLAARYKDEPMIGAYDLLNEPNWDFDGSGNKNGCKDEKQDKLWSFYQEATAAIRAIDPRHMIIIEGNCWGNNYKGMPKPWDANMALSFHKYWNVNDDASIEQHLKLREQTGLPLWLGESGENSNVWFADAIRLVEKHEIGWAFWPLKKIGFNQPLEIKVDPAYDDVVATLTGEAKTPVSADKAYSVLMKVASHDVRFENNEAHPDVIDAMFRQPHDATTRPFRKHVVGAKGATIPAWQYDLGVIGAAYADADAANYHVSTGGQRTPWNKGRAGRNDGVDLERSADGALKVTDFTAGEWLRYTVSATAGRYAVSLVGEGPMEVAVNGGAAVKSGAIVSLMAGTNTLVVESTGAATVSAIKLTPAK